eukprot:1160808-Pelagomonas_calceolata.AAC.23
MAPILAQTPVTALAWALDVVRALDGTFHMWKSGLRRLRKHISSTQTSEYMIETWANVLQAIWDLLPSCIPVMPCSSCGNGLWVRSLELDNG